LHEAYSELMQEYKELGHMNQNNEDARCTEGRYYLQRHSLCNSHFQQSAHSRAIVDGSCLKNKGLCLSDMLIVQPTV
jgi:hypothetical protein